MSEKKAPHDEAKDGDGKTYGLVLDSREGTRPATPHTIPGLDGFFVPGVPTVVGGPGETPLAAAVEASKDPGNEVTLVVVKDKDVDGLRGEAQEHADAARNAVREIVKRARVEGIDDGEVERLNDEVAALGQEA